MTGELLITALLPFAERERTPRPSQEQLQVALRGRLGPFRHQGEPGGPKRVQGQRGGPGRAFRGLGGQSGSFRVILTRANRGR
jgi:hypothetical protein